VGGQGNNLGALMNNDNSRQAARMEGEPFDAYKLRRKMNNLLTKAELRPKMFWNSSANGAYVKANQPKPKG
jgi:hypothetical protein